MDIERLKELRKVVEDKSCRTEIDDDGEELQYEIEDKELMWALEECSELIDAEIARQSEIEKVVCPDCGGSGVYQEYDDEFDRYHVYACYKCEGTGEIARQSVTSEEVAEAIEYVNDWRKESMTFDRAVGILPTTSEETKAYETILTALQAYQPKGE